MRLQCIYKEEFLILPWLARELAQSVHTRRVDRMLLKSSDMGDHLARSPRNLGERSVHRDSDSAFLEASVLFHSMKPHSKHTQQLVKLHQLLSAN